MPKFFDPHDLTPRQKARWTHAISEYKLITDQRVADYMANHDAGKSKALVTDGAVRLILGINPPGDPSSALFARLLDGKQALPFAPPTRFGYPWYPLFDLPEDAHPVADVTIAKTEPNDPAAGNGVIALLIDGCPWQVIWANAAAANLINTDRSRFVHMDHLHIDAMLNESKPVFVIRYKDAPDFRLSIGREVINLQRRNIADMMKMRFKRVGRLNYGNGNPVILGVTENGSDVRKRGLDSTLMLATVDTLDKATDAELDYVDLEVDVWTVRLMNQVRGDR